MHILIVTQYFWPENFRINDITKGFLERGHQVTVLTGVPNYPDGKFFSGYGFFKNRKQDYHDAKVVRVPLLPRGKGGTIRLLLNYLSFMVFASILGPLFCRKKYDLIFVFEPSPITVCLPAIVIKKFRKIPIVFFVLDLWPESLSATGAVSSRRVLGMVAKLVRFIYKHCDRILVPSRGYYKPIQNLGVSREKLGYFPNSADELYLQKAKHVTRNELNLPDGFIVMFAGNMGVAQDIPTIIAAAELVKERADIHWVILGDGRMYSWAEEQVKLRGLSMTVHLLGRHPLEEMPAYFSQSDAMLVTLRRNPTFALTVPARIQAYMACGRPIIAALDGEGARIVEEAGAGLACPSESPESLVNAVLLLERMSAADRVKMGNQGRKYFEANFERNVVLNSLDVMMENLIRQIPTAENVELI